MRARLPLICDWLVEHEPDVLAIQETKVENDKFPYQEFQDLGYEVAVNGQKAWNGVAFITKEPMTEVRSGFGDPLMPEDARVISGRLGNLRLINTYVPNGNTVGSDKWEYKMQWLEKFAAYLREGYSPAEDLIWLGDINIAPRREDVYDSAKFMGGVGHHPEEFKRLSGILEFGLEDLFLKFEQGPGHFTFWDFVIPRAVERNLGWRIDHIYGTSSVAARATKVWVDKEARLGSKPSDHTFVIGEFAR